jgi:tyrosinase
MATGTPSHTALAAPLRYRRSAAQLTQGQRTLVAEAFARVQAIDDDRGYGYHAGIHGLPLPLGCDNAHGTPYFLPWHRAYLYFFERALRDQVHDATLTWWDWRVSSRRPAAMPDVFTTARIGARANPLLSGTVTPLALQQGGNRVPAKTSRRPGASSSLPTSAEVDRALAIRDFLGFNEAVEELHNRVHVWVGGHMGQIPYAAFDPIFWAHHTMIDRLWRVWQLRHPGARPPDAVLDAALPPFRMTVHQTLDVTALGYDYAVASSSAVVG